MNWIATRLFGKPDAQSVTWWMVEKQFNLPAQIAGYAGYLLIFSIIFGKPEYALSFMLSMLAHESGHLFFFIANDINAVILMLFPIGAAALPISKSENERSDKLPWKNVAWLLLAGPIMNMFMMLVGVYLISKGIFPEFSKNFVFTNGLLGLFNLLPLGNLDGGQFFHVIFSSLNNKNDKRLAILGSILTGAFLSWVVYQQLHNGLMGILISGLKNFGGVFFFILFIIGLLHKNGQDNPKHAKSKQAMSVESAVTLFLSYMVCALIMINFLHL